MESTEKNCIMIIINIKNELIIFTDIKQPKDYMIVK